MTESRSDGVEGSSKMFPTRRTPWPKLVLWAVATIVPAALGYCKARDEAQTQASLVNRQADAGYQTLVDSVHHLEQVVESQQETLRLLTRELHVTDDVHVPVPVQAAFEPLPADTAAALRESDEAAAK